MHSPQMKTRLVGGRREVIIFNFVTDVVCGNGLERLVFIDELAPCSVIWLPTIANGMQISVSRLAYSVSAYTVHSCMLCVDGASKSEMYNTWVGGL